MQVQTHTQPLPYIPTELLYHIVGYAVTENLHDFWWTTRQCCPSKVLRTFQSLLCTSHQLRDITFKVLADTFKFPSHDHDRLQERAAREAILAVNVQLHSSQRRLVAFPPGSLGELYVRFHDIQEQTHCRLIECENLDELHAICERGTRLAEDVLCAVRPSLLADAVGAVVVRYVKGLRAIQEMSSALHACNRALAQDAGEPLGKAEVEQHSATLLQFKQVLRECLRTKPKKSANGLERCILWTWISKRGLDLFRSTAQVLQERVSQSPDLSQDDLFLALLCPASQAIASKRQ